MPDILDASEDHPLCLVGRAPGARSTLTHNVDASCYGEDGAE